MPRFVVQKHAASRLHYDFRLEVGGVYRSWSVPKGPSIDPKDRRLAVEVEDHSLGWGEFEGVIEDGYGAGTVIVWDRGTYQNLTKQDGKPVRMDRALAAGHASLWLEGKKLRGGFVLMRMAGKGDGEWLLIKRRDAEAQAGGDILAARPESIITGKTIEDVGQGRRRRAA